MAAAIITEQLLGNKHAMIVLDKTTIGDQKAVTYQMRNLLTNMPSATIYLWIDEGDQ
jgi:hypothetical protein